VQDVVDDNDAGVLNESIEVEVGLTTKKACEKLYSVTTTTALSVPISEARSDDDNAEEVLNNERNKASVTSEREAAVQGESAADADVQNVDITDDYIGDVSVNATVDANQDCLNQASVRAAVIHMSQKEHDNQGMIDEMYNMIIELEEKAAEKEAQIQIQKAIHVISTANLEAENRDLVATDSEKTLIISVLEQDVKTKTIVINKMSADVQYMNTQLEEKSVEISDLTERLQLENEASVVSTTKYLEQISTLKDDLTAKTNLIEEMSMDIKSLKLACDEIAVENVNLANQLHATKSENVGLKVDLNSLVVINKDKVKKSDDFTTQLRLSKSRIDELETQVNSLLNINKERVHKITLLEEELTGKKIKLEEMSADIKDKSKTLEEKSLEVADIKEQLNLSKTEIDKLKSEIEASDKVNKENARLMTVLIDELGSKQATIDEMCDNIEHNNEVFGETSAEMADLTKRLELSKTEIDELKKKAEILITSNDEKDKVIKKLECDMESKSTLINELTDAFQQKNERCNKIMSENDDLNEQLKLSTTANDNLGKLNKSSEAKIVELVNIVESMSRTLRDEKAIMKGEIEEMKAKLVQETNEKAAATLSLQVKDAENNHIAEALQAAKAESDKLKMEVETLVATNKEKVDQLSILENNLAAKECMIDEMYQNIKHNKVFFEEKTVEIDDLTKELNFITFERDELNRKVNDLEKMNNKSSLEIARLLSSLNEYRTLNEVLQVRHDEDSLYMESLDKIKKEYEEKTNVLQDSIKSLTKSLEDERLNHATQIEGMKEVMEKFVRMSEESLEKANSKKLAQKKTIDELSKSLDAAKAEIRNKDKILAEKSDDLLKYVDLAAQFKTADCGVAGDLLKYVEEIARW
jgi:chromosome segregation ATPase